MNKKWVIIGAACIAVIAIAVALSLNSAFRDASSATDAVTVSGEGQGFLGPVVAQVTLDGSGKIIGLDITGDQDGVPDIGGPAIATLSEQILRSGSIEGVEAVSGATITSNGVLNAIRNAISGA